MEKCASAKSNSNSFLILIAKIVTTSKALAPSSNALVPSSELNSILIPQVTRFDLGLFEHVDWKEHAVQCMLAPGSRAPGMHRSPTTMGTTCSKSTYNGETPWHRQAHLPHPLHPITKDHRDCSSKAEPNTGARREVILVNPFSVKKK